MVQKSAPHLQKFNREKPLTCAIIAVGTELTTGQILNSNAQWLSKKLFEKGIVTSLHTTIPDHRETILLSLQQAEKLSDIIFITGGLGPTSDDFTREVVAQWLNQPLDWDETSLQALTEKMKLRHQPVREGQKQECYFPRGARILVNSVGTANGFHSINADKKEIYVLPGPPREIQGLWQDFIESDMQTKAIGYDGLKTWSWDTLGRPESEVAERVQSALSKFSAELICKIDIGYRVHIPYVEVKITFQKSLEKSLQDVREALESTLQEFTWTKNGGDVSEDLYFYLQQWIKNHSSSSLASSASAKIKIFDGVSDGYLVERLKKVFQLPGLHYIRGATQGTDHRTKRNSNQSETEVKSFQSGMELHLSLQAVSPDTARVGIMMNQQWHWTELYAPKNFLRVRGRSALYFVELAFFFWYRHLSSNSQNTSTSRTL